MFSRGKLKEEISKSTSLRYGFYKGEVMDTEDLEEKLSRVKVSIPNLTESIPVEDLPWYAVRQTPTGSRNAHTDIPSEGSEVVVEFPTDDIYNGVVSYTVVSRPPAKA